MMMTILKLLGAPVFAPKGEKWNAHYVEVSYQTYLANIARINYENEWRTGFELSLDID